MSEPSSTGSTPFTVFDYLGLAFLLVPPGVIVEALMKGEALTILMFIYAAPAVLIGAVCIYIGRNWNKLKIKTTSSIVSAIDYLSKSYIVLFSIFVLFLIGIAISPMILWPTSPNTMQFETHIFSMRPITILIGVALLLIGAVTGVALSSRGPGVNRNIMTTKPPLPIDLSDEDKQFRFGLRTFVLSSLNEQNTAFTQFAGRLSNTDSNTVFTKDPETTRAAGILFDPLLRATYDPKWIALRKQTDTTIEAMDPQAVIEKVQAYFRSYDESQIYFLYFIRLAGIDPTQLGMLSHWIDIDARAMQAFNNLVTSPLAGALAHSRFPPASTRFAVYLTAPNNATRDK